MKPDLYTKIVLTLIALALVMIACNQYVHPATAAQAQGALRVQFAMDQGDPVFFDAQTGEIWQYYPVERPRFATELSGQPKWKSRLKKLGEPLSNEYNYFDAHEKQ